jgi:hypothetical protein
MRIQGTIAAAVMVISGCSSGSGSGPAPNGLPGGTSGKSVLQSHHLLDTKGRVAPGPTAPKGSNVNAAICNYVFGTADEVGAVAKLDGTVTLSKNSGYLYSGGNGSGVECVYEISGKAQFELVIWDKKAPGTARTKHQVTIDLPDQFYGASAYAPSYHGATIAASDVKRWLRDAATRVAHGSV